MIVIMINGEPIDELKYCPKHKEWTFVDNESDCCALELETELQEEDTK